MENCLNIDSNSGAIVLTFSKDDELEVGVFKEALAGKPYNLCSVSVKTFFRVPSKEMLSSDKISMYDSMCAIDALSSCLKVSPVT